MAAYNRGEYELALALSQQSLDAPGASADAASQARAMATHGAILIALERADDAIPFLKPGYATAAAELDRTDPALLYLQYTYGMALFHTARMHEAHDVLSAHRLAENERLGRDDLLDRQIYDAQSLTHLSSLAQARIGTGAVDGGLALFTSDLVSINISVDDTSARSAFLADLYDFHFESGRLEDIPLEEIESFVSRSEALGDYAGDDVLDQLYYLARIYEGVGRQADARTTDMRNPPELESLYWTQSESDEEAAFALLEEAADRLQLECESICSRSEVLLEIREFQGARLEEAGRTAEAAAAYEGALLAAQRIYPRDESRIDEIEAMLATYYDSLGRAGEAYAMRLRSQGTKADFDLDGNVELTIARRLREQGFSDLANDIIRQEMACAYPDPAGKEEFYQPCSGAWLAMREYSGTLDPGRERDRAEFYRLPQEAISAYLANDGETARAKAGRLVDLGLKLFKPGDHDLYLAMGVFRGISSRQHAPQYEIPRRWRICEWEPQTAAGQVTQSVIRQGDDAAANPPPMMVSTRAADPYFSFGFGHLTAKDPKGAFYHALGSGLAAYAGQCTASGRPEEAIAFINWALSTADEMGYPLGDQESLLLTKASLETDLGRFADAERSYLRLVEPYLAGTAKSRNPFNPHKPLEQLIQLYAQLGKAEQLLVLLTKMEESGQFGNKEFSNSEMQFRPIREAMYMLFLAKRDFAKAESILPYLEPWSVIEEARYSGADADELAELERTQISNWAMRLAELSDAKGNPDHALDLIGEAIDMNDAYLAALPAAEAGENDLRSFLINGRLYAMRGGIFARMGDWEEALRAIETSGIFQFGDKMLHFAREAAGPDASPEEVARLLAEDADVGQLVSALAASYSAAAEMAMRTGDEDAAERYLEQSLLFPRDSRWSVFNQQIRYVGVALAIRRPEWRQRGLEDAKVLVAGLEQQWKLASRSSLDAGAQLEMMQMAPAMFGEVMALRWADKMEGGTTPSDGEIFRNIQWAIMSAADLAIAQSIARSELSQADPAFTDLIAERDLVSSTLYRDTRPGQEVKIGEQGESRFSANVARLRAIEDEIARDYPRFYEITTSDPVELDRVQRLLTSREALLLASPGRFGTQLVMVTRDEMRWLQSPLTLEEVTLAVRRLRYFLGAGGDVTAAEARQWESEVDGGWQGFDRTMANRLYQEFIAPFSDLLKGRDKLLVSPGGPLGSLPFSVLVSEIAPGADNAPDALRATRWLIDDFELTQIPAVRSFVLLREEQRKDSKADFTFAGFGDPLLEGEAIERGARGTRGPGAQFDKLWDGPSVDLAVLRKMDRLPGTAIELQRLRRAFDAPETSIHLGSAATEQLVRTSDLFGVDVLAFATHGVMAGEIKGLAEPGLVLSPPVEASELDDGYLSASEIATLELSADWVILSACNTAASDGQIGASALSGLARSFFHAGARGLLVSHWYIRDDVAAQLTAKAVEARRMAPALSRAGALREAIRTIRLDRSADGLVRNDLGEMVENSWAHPNAWAPFTLVAGE